MAQLDIATVQLLFSFLNVLVIPVLWYVIKLEKRISVLETRVSLHDQYARAHLDMIDKLFTAAAVKK